MKKTSKNNGDSYCLNCFDSIRREYKFRCHVKVCKTKDFWRITFPTQKYNVLKLNQFMKLD